jgi:membrane-associated phospholipid phosphatase
MERKMSFSLSTFPQKIKALGFGLRAREEIIARWISNLFCPPQVGVLAAFVFLFYAAPDPRSVWPWVALTIPLITLPPLAYVFWLMRKGELADFHMPSRRSRMKPLSLMVVWGGTCILLLRFWGAPRVLIVILLTALAYMIVLSIITLFWKISFHSTAISAAASVGLVTSGFTGWSVTIALLIPVVAWARAYLRRHTLTQIAAGCFVGTSIGLLILI